MVNSTYTTHHIHTKWTEVVERLSPNKWQHSCLTSAFTAISRCWWAHNRLQTTKSMMSTLFMSIKHLHRIWRLNLEVLTDLEDYQKDKKQKHVDNVEDDRCFDSNAQEQSRTDKQPVFDQHVPQPPAYKHIRTCRRHRPHTGNDCRVYIF